MRSTATGGVVALYPSPAGATEPSCTLEAWDELVAANPVLGDLEPDAEALVVNRMAEPPQYAIAPIDRCYELVGPGQGRAGRASPAAPAVERRVAGLLRPAARGGAA